MVACAGEWSKRHRLQLSRKSARLIGPGTRWGKVPQESSVPRCGIVKKPPFFLNLKQSMEVERWEDALGTPV